MHRLWRHQAGLVGLFAALYFFNLGGTHLWDEDEAYFAAASRETCTTGHFVVPTFNGELSLHKPAFMYWIMRGGVALFGENEFAVRSGSAVFGIANVLLVFHLGRLLFSTGVGLWSGLIYGTALQIFLINRAAVADPELSFFCTLALLLFVIASPWRNAAVEQLDSAEFGRMFLPRGRDWLFVYCSLAVAVLIKGPVGIVLPMAVIGLFLLLVQWQLHGPDMSHRHRIVRVLSFFTWVFAPLRILRTTLQMHPWLAILAIALIAGPWYLSVGILTDGEWLAGFLGVHNLGRFSAAMEGHQAGPWFFIAAIVVGMFPWCLFNLQVIGLWRRALTGSLKDRLPGFLLLSWVAVWVATFTIASTKLPHYIAPAYPALAVLFGRYVDRWWRQTEVESVGLLRAAWGSMVIVGLAIMVALPVASAMLLPGIGILGAVGAIPFLGGIAGIVFEERRMRRAAGCVLVAMSISFAGVLLSWGAPQVDAFQSSPQIGQWVRDLRQTDNPSRIAIWGGFDASLVYYLGQPIRRIGQSDVADFRDSARDDTFLIITDQNYARLEPHAQAEWKVVRRTRRFMRDEHLLLAVPARSSNTSQIAATDTTSRR